MTEGDLSFFTVSEDGWRSVTDRDKFLNWWRTAPIEERVANMPSGLEFFTQPSNPRILGSIAFRRDEEALRKIAEFKSELQTGELLAFHITTDEDTLLEEGFSSEHGSNLGEETVREDAVFFFAHHEVGSLQWDFLESEQPAILVAALPIEATWVSYMYAYDLYMDRIVTAENYDAEFCISCDQYLALLDDGYESSSLHSHENIYYKM